MNFLERKHVRGKKDLERIRGEKKRVMKKVRKKKRTRREKTEKYIYMYIHTHVYIYRERERGRGREKTWIQGWMLAAAFIDRSQQPCQQSHPLHPWRPHRRAASLSRPPTGFCNARESLKAGASAGRIEFNRINYSQPRGSTMTFDVRKVWCINPADSPSLMDGFSSTQGYACLAYILWGVFNDFPS